MRSRARTRWALLAFAVMLVVAVVTSVFEAGSSGVRSAASAARIPIPSRRTVHLDARGYAVSFAVDDTVAARARVPRLHVSIARAGTGEQLELRTPTKRYTAAANGEEVVDQYLITVPVAGMYDVTVTADEQTDGFLVLGDRPIDALGRVFRTWVILAVAGASLAVAVVLLVHRRAFTVSLAVRVDRRTLTPDDDAAGRPADPE